MPRALPLQKKRKLIPTSSHIRPIILRRMSHQRPPSTPNVQHPISGFQAQLLAHHRHLVVLQFLERLHAVDILDQARGVDHPRSEEPRVKVVAAVVVVPDLVFVLCLGVEDDVGDEVEEDVAEDLDWC